MQIFPNIWGVLRDPDLWCDPEIFRPERFITEEGATLRPEYWIPFGMGKKTQNKHTGMYGVQQSYVFFIFKQYLISKKMDWTAGLQSYVS